METGGEKVIITGKIYKFEDDVNTDEIIPARYLNTSDPKELASHVMEDADPQFPEKVRKGDIIAAGKNFGCGSSREHAPIAIRAAGITCVIAESFARIFYRNAFNIGLTIVECPAAAAEMKNKSLSGGLVKALVPFFAGYFRANRVICPGISREYAIASFRDGLKKVFRLDSGHLNCPCPYWAWCFRQKVRRLWHVCHPCR